MTQVNQNFTDIINGLSDGTKDLSINALTVGGNFSVSGNTTLGNASSDDITFTGSMASSLPIKTTNTYDIGSSLLGLRALYFGANSQTVNIKGSSSMSATWTFTLPVSAGSAGQYMSNSGSGVAAWTSFTPPKVTRYTTGGASGTHSFTGSPLYVKIILAGGGGGGGGAGSGAGAGGNGGNSTFDTNTAAGGTGGGAAGSDGGPGGAATLGSGYAGIAIHGGRGVTNVPGGTGVNAPGAPGGANALGGAGQTLNTTSGAGQAGEDNTGAGGGGGEGGTGVAPGSGGGAGAYMNIIVSGATLSALSGSASYAVGAAGSAGAGAAVGGAGGSGYLEVTEFYQ